MLKRCVLAWICTSAVLAAPLNVYVEVNPPLVSVSDTGVSGAMVEAFEALLAENGQKVNMAVLPARRAMVQIERSANSCMLGATYSAANAEVINYVVRLAPLFVSAYSLRDRKLSGARLTDLQAYHIGTPDVAAVRLLLDESGLQYEVLSNPAKGVEMLAARRFDVLIADQGALLRGKEIQSPIKSLFDLPRLDLWLACNRNMSPQDSLQLRQALKDGLFSRRTNPIWRRYGLADYYQEVRSVWRINN